MTRPARTPHAPKYCLNQPPPTAYGPCKKWPPASSIPVCASSLFRVGQISPHRAPGRLVRFRTCPLQLPSTGFAQIEFGTLLRLPRLFLLLVQIAGRRRGRRSLAVTRAPTLFCFCSVTTVSTLAAVACGVIKLAMCKLAVVAIRASAFEEGEAGEASVDGGSMMVGRACRHRPLLLLRACVATRSVRIERRGPFGLEEVLLLGGEDKLGGARLAGERLVLQILGRLRGLVQLLTALLLSLVAADAAAAALSPRRLALEAYVFGGKDDGIAMGARPVTGAHGAASAPRRLPCG